jgi:hypothetical protein
MPRIFPRLCLLALPFCFLSPRAASPQESDVIPLIPPSEPKTLAEMAATGTMIFPRTPGLFADDPCCKPKRSLQEHWINCKEAVGDGIHGVGEALHGLRGWPLRSRQCDVECTPCSEPPGIITPTTYTTRYGAFQRFRGASAPQTIYPATYHTIEMPASPRR